jgi:primosomal protein N' (replication factor Y)
VPTPLSRQPASKPGVARFAQVMVDSPLPQLDKPFDYLVPEKLAEACLVGSLVKVKMHGRRLDGWVVGLSDQTEFSGKLASIERVVSAVPPLNTETIALVRETADHYLGSFADVVRAAVPPRHARAEAHMLANPLAPTKWQLVADGGWAEVKAGLALRQRIKGQTKPQPWAVWQAVPTHPWASDIAALVSDAQHAGRGVLIIAPDETDVRNISAALSVNKLAHVVLTAQATPEARYRSFVALRLGQVNVCVGTRNAVFAPVTQLGLIIIWDESDENLSSPQAPYWQTGEVAINRAKSTGAALVFGGWVNSLRAQQLIGAKQAAQVSLPSTKRKTNLAHVLVAGSEDETKIDKDAQIARLPYGAWRTIKDGLEKGPVLVHVAQRGDVALGADLTATQFRQAFKGVQVIVATAQHPVREVSSKPAIVIATSGAEPNVKGGYQAAVILDGRTELARPNLDTRLAAARRWFAIAALVKPEALGGKVAVVAPPDSVVTQALIRWSPAAVAENELAERTELHLPPAVWAVLMRAETEEALVDFISALQPQPPTTTHGPFQSGLEDLSTKAKKREWAVLLSAPQDQIESVKLAIAQTRRNGPTKKLPVVAVMINPTAIY